MTSAQPAVRRARRLAAYVCFVECAVMAGFGAVSLVQLLVGTGSQATWLGPEGVLVLLFAAGAGLLGRLWLGGSQWPATPTVVWHVLLVPVAVSLFQSGQLAFGLVLTLAIVTAIGATVAAREGQASK